jgi:hypothetical protein
MERATLQELVEWKTSPNRKPLILKGVRQSGKTWLLQHFGAMHYRDVAYFSFDEQPDLKQFFELDKDPERILRNLSIVRGSQIEAGQTLVIFDEIQECNAALNSLKYFFEMAPAYHIACAGSLLGVALSKPAGFPVGKVDFLHVHPLGFTEFLRGTGETELACYVESIETIEPLPELFFKRLSEYLKYYFITGGMPEVVERWRETGDVAIVQKTLSNLLDAYERDFAKHAERSDFPKLSLIWHSIPSQLGRDNKKFLYRAIKEGARAREYEDALQWLCDAGLTYKLSRVEKPALPLPAYDDISSFKLYACDVGLLRRLAGLPASAFGEGTRLFTEFKGSLSENFVLQTLDRQLEVMPRYWTDGKGRAEVDFVVQVENDIIPIEVKAGTSTESRSLASWAQRFPEKAGLRVRFSMRNLKRDGTLLNIPLFLADRSIALISKANASG